MQRRRPAESPFGSGFVESAPPPGRAPGGLAPRSIGGELEEAQRVPEVRDVRGYLAGNAGLARVFGDDSSFPSSKVATTRQALLRARHGFLQSVQFAALLPDALLGDLPARTAVALVASREWAGDSRRPSQRLVRRVFDTSTWGLALLSPVPGERGTFSLEVVVAPEGRQHLVGGFTLGVDGVRQCLFLRWTGVANWMRWVGAELSGVHVLVGADDDSDPWRFERYDAGVDVGAADHVVQDREFSAAPRGRDQMRQHDAFWADESASALRGYESPGSLRGLGAEPSRRGGSPDALRGRDAGERLPSALRGVGEERALRGRDVYHGPPSALRGLGAERDTWDRIDVSRSRRAFAGGHFPPSPRDWPGELDEFEDGAVFSPAKRARRSERAGTWTELRGDGVGDREATRRLRALRELVGEDVFAVVFRDGSWQTAVLRARSAILQSVALSTGTTLREADDRGLRRVMSFEFSEHTLDLFAPRPIAAVAELDAAIRNAAVFFEALYGPPLSVIREMSWGALAGRLTLSSMKRIAALRFARVLLTTGRADSHDELRSLFALSSSDPEVQAQAAVDTPDLIADRIRGAAADAGRRGDRRFSEAAGLSRLRVCASVAGGYPCASRGCRYLHERAAFDALPESEQERLRVLAGRLAAGTPSLGGVSRAPGGRRFAERHGGLSRARLAQPASRGRAPPV